MKSVWMVAAAALVATACVPREALDRKTLEAEELARKYNADHGRAEAAEAKLAEVGPKLEACQKDQERLPDLEKRVSALEEQLTNKEAERRALLEANTRLTALNDELSKSSKKLAQAKDALEKRSSEYESLAQSLREEIKSGKIELSELKGKMNIKLKDKILFDSGSTRIDKEGLAALAKIAKTLGTVKGRSIRVEGHTDNVPTDPKGPFPSNWELSTARALAVVKFIIEKGVDPTVVAAAGFGEYQPVAANTSAQNRSLNRRIEIVLAPAK